MQLIPALCLFAALAGGARSAPPVAPPPAPGSLGVCRLLEDGHPVRIVCFGDSLTGAYYHTGSRRAWVDVLGLTLERIYPRARIEMINAGISGNTTGEGLARMEADVIRRRPQLVVAMFGLNDVARGKGPEEFRGHLEEIVSRSRAAGAEVILMTPNSTYPDDAARPPGKVAEYVEVVRQVGRALRVPVADAYRAFEDIRAIDARAWSELMSETIHPNMRGDKLFAEEAAWTISGRHLWLDELPPLRPGFPRTLARLQARQPVRVVAMTPFDSLVGPALRSLFPGADVRVTPWKPDPKDLEGIGEQAKAVGWRRFHGHPGPDEPDLVVLAVPARALAATPEEFYRYYSRIVSLSLPLGQGGWDVLAILPSVAQPELNPAEKTAERMARRVMLGQDVPWLERAGGDETGPGALLSRKLGSLLAP